MPTAIVIEPEVERATPEDEDYFEVTDLEVLKDLQVPDSQADKATKEPEPTAPVAKQDKKGDLGKALKETRGKAKKAREAFDKVEKERAALNERLANERRLIPTVDEIKLPGFSWTTEELADIHKDAEGASTYAEVGTVIARAVAKKQGEVQKQTEQVVNGALQKISQRMIDDKLENHMARLEERARGRYPDYDQKLKEAGILDGLRKVNPNDPKSDVVDPALARSIFTATDPAEEAYQIAVGKLGGAEVDPDAEVASEEDPEPEIPATPVKPKPAVQPKAVVDAARAAEKRVLDTVTTNGSKPGGLRHIPEAGQPQRLSREDVYRIAQENPEKYLEMKKNPEFRRWFLGGTA